MIKCMRKLRLKNKKIKRLEVAEIEGYKEDEEENVIEFSHICSIFDISLHLCIYSFCRS